MTTCLWKSCSFGWLWVPFINCCQFMYLVISFLVLRAGCGIWLYQFLIIAYLFTFLNIFIILIFDLLSRMLPNSAQFLLFFPLHFIYWSVHCVLSACNLWDFKELWPSLWDNSLVCGLVWSNMRAPQTGQSHKLGKTVP